MLCHSSSNVTVCPKTTEADRHPISSVQWYQPRTCMGSFSCWIISSTQRLFWPWHYTQWIKESSHSANTFLPPPSHSSFLLQITRTDQASSTSCCKLPSHQRTESSLQPAPKWKVNSRVGALLGWHAFSRTIMEGKLIHLALSTLTSYHVLKWPISWGSIVYQRLHTSGAVQNPAVTLDPPL